MPGWDTAANTGYKASQEPCPVGTPCMLGGYTMVVDQAGGDSYRKPLFFDFVSFSRVLLTQSY